MPCAPLLKVPWPSSFPCGTPARGQQHLHFHTVGSESAIPNCKARAIAPSSQSLTFPYWKGKETALLQTSFPFLGQEPYGDKKEGGHGKASPKPWLGFYPNRGNSPFPTGIKDPSCPIGKERIGKKPH
jgi:hypothetical protein